jgi:hypothetical protein
MSDYSGDDPRPGGQDRSRRLPRRLLPSLQPLESRQLLSGNRAALLVKPESIPRTTHVHTATIKSHHAETLRGPHRAQAPPTPNHRRARRVPASHGGVLEKVLKSPRIASTTVSQPVAATPTPVTTSIASPQSPQLLKPILGSAITPSGFPNSSPQDYVRYFQEAAEMGSHVRLEVNWASLPAMQDVTTLTQLAKNYGLKFCLTIDPLSVNRTTPAVPTTAGGTSFESPQVQEAFTQQALAYAALKPDVLGLGAEVNVLALSNPAEFRNYVAMVTKTYHAIKTAYPEQEVEVGFQYDVMKADPTLAQFNLLSQFQGACDIFAFSTYPKQTFGAASSIPADYYSSLQSQLQRLNLTEAIGFSEVGWDAANPSEEVEQENFFKRLPGLVMGLNPRYLDLALLNDVANVFQGPRSYLNLTGIRYNDGTPKRAWAIVDSLSLDATAAGH